MAASRGVALFAVTLCLCFTAAPAAEPQAEVAAFLVFPDVSVEAVPVAGALVETMFSVTNTSSADYVIHVTFFNGDEGSPTYCFECELQATLDGSTTRTFSVRVGPSQDTLISAIDNSINVSCPFSRGFITVSLEDTMGNTVSDNVLYGHQTVVDYTNGRSYSSGAVPFRGEGNNADQVFDFDDFEYGKMPRLVAADFIAPNLTGQAFDGFDAYLTLFTLSFARQQPPSTSCVVTGVDAAGNLFTAALDFGCWTRVELENISPEFAFPNLGGGEEHGWLNLNCTVTNGPSSAVGAVHGALFQVEPTGTVWGGAGAAGAPSAWARTLAQSVTTGDPVSLDLGPLPPTPAGKEGGER